MVENSFSVSVFCVTAALTAVLLRQYCREQAMLISLAACSVIILAFVGFVEPIYSDIRDIFEQAGVAESYISLIFKGFAICFITQLTCEICKDSGEGAIASVAEMWGRGALVIMCLPLIKKIFEIINEIP